MLLLSAACSKDGNDDDDAEETPVSKIRVINAVPDSPTLTAQINESFFANASFGQSSLLTERTPGNVELDVEYTLAGGQTQELIDDLELDIDDGDEFTVVVSGPLESPSATVIEETIADLSGGEAELHVVHAASAFGRLDFYVTDGGSDITGSSPFATLGLGEFSPVTLVDSGAYRVLVTSEGDDVIHFDSGSFELAALTRRLLLALDYFGPGDSRLRVVSVGPVASSTFPSESLPVALRVVNLVADAPSLDTYVGGTAEPPMFPALAYANVSGYTTLDAGSTRLTATLEGDPAAAVFDDQFQLVAGESRSLIVAGTYADDRTAGRLVLDQTRRVATESQLNVVHGAGSIQALDFYLLSPSQPVGDSTPVFGSMSLLTNGTVAVEPGTYDVVFTLPDDGTTVLGPERVTIAANGIYLLVVADAYGGGTPLRLVLADDFTN